MPGRDAAWLAFALVCRPPDHLVAPTVRYRNAGRVTTDGPFTFGVLCNRLFHAPGDRGAFLVSPTGTVRFGSNVTIATSARISVAGRLVIGSRTRINTGTRILANAAVTIGDDVAIGPGCLIIDDDLHDLVVGGSPRERSAPIVVGDRVWIGSRCTLLKGAVVGTGSIIAAGSVVSGRIPPGVVAGGVPARVLADDARWSP